MSPTSKLAIDGRILSRYFYFHEQYVKGGVPEKNRRVINGVPVIRDNDGRILRRWDQGGTVTRKGAERLLAKFHLSMDDFTEWCAKRNHNPTIRGEI